MSVFRNFGGVSGGKAYPKREAVDGSNINSSGNGTFTYDATGDDRFMSAVVTRRKGTNPTACNFNGIAGTELAVAMAGGSNDRIAALYVWKESQLPSSSGDYILSVTWGDTHVNSWGQIACYSNIDQAVPYGTVEDAYGGSTAFEYTLTTVQGEFVDLWNVIGENGASNRNIITSIDGSGIEGTIESGDIAGTFSWSIANSYIENVPTSSETHTMHTDDEINVNNTYYFALPLNAA